MPLEVRYTYRPTHVIARLVGEPSLEEMLDALQQLGAASVSWTQDAVVVDLRGVSSEFGFTEQLRVGEAVGRDLSHLRKAAAVVQAHRITRVGEKAARHGGADALVFADEQEAEHWVAV